MEKYSKNLDYSAFKNPKNTLKTHKNQTSKLFMKTSIFFGVILNLVRLTTSTSYEYLPRTVSRYDKSKTRSGSACENYNDYDTYGYQICDENASCTNSTVSNIEYIYCTCNDGFTADGGAYSPLFGYGCVDNDECTLGTDDCDDNATCENTSGSYTCSCDQGFYGDGTSCKAIVDVLANCEPGYFSTETDTVCKKFFEVDCKTDGTVDIDVYMSYVNNILVYPYNQTDGLIEIGFLDPDCVASPTKAEVENFDDSAVLVSTDLVYSYNLGLSDCGFRVLRDLSGYDYFDNALILTSQYLAEQADVSSKANYTMFRFQCVYNTTESIVSTDEINHDVDLSIQETGHYQLEMNSYSDSNFSILLDTETELFDNDAVYVKIESPDGIVEAGRELVIESCWMNDYEDDFDKSDIELIQDFCVGANFTELVVVKDEEDRSSASFEFYPFLIDDNYEQIYLSCSVYFKEVGSDDVDCSITSTRRKRSIKSELLPSVHQGAINDNFRLQHGPIKRQFKLLR